jgi:hypothetical protein
MERASRAGSVIVLAVATALVASRPADAEETDPIRGRIALIQDLTLDDTSRTKAARELATDYKLARSGGIEALLKLGKETQNENVQLQVAVALAGIRGSAGTQVARDNLALFSTWLGEGQDKSLRYWAAMMVANAQTEEAAATLARTLGTLDPKSDRGLRSAVVAAMSTLEGTLGAKAEEELLKLLDDANAELRVEGIEGLRKSKTPRPNVRVINRLLKVAKEDEVEGVWRCATLALREVVPGDLREGLNIPPGVTKEDRLSRLKSWERRWERERKRIEAAQKQPE